MRGSSFCFFCSCCFGLGAGGTVEDFFVFFFVLVREPRAAHVPNLFQRVPHALQSEFRPAGPFRHSGVCVVPQFTHFFSPTSVLRDLEQPDGSSVLISTPSVSQTQGTPAIAAVDGCVVITSLSFRRFARPRTVASTFSALVRFGRTVGGVAV